VTEAEWLHGTDPDPMLAFVLGRPAGGVAAWFGRLLARSPQQTPWRASARKVRLLACACCRRLRDVLGDERSLRAVEVSESFADGRASPAELNAAFQAGVSAYRDLAARPAPVNLTTFEPPPPGAAVYLAESFAARAACFAADDPPDDAIASAVRAATLLATQREAGSRAAAALGAAARVALLRDLFGNPFRPPTLDPDWLAWNGGLVPRLAAAIAEEGRFEDLPILADALEEAGCADAELLGHLRGPGPHVRGCWALDLLLGLS
jgi:hypothetical protein